MPRLSEMISKKTKSKLNNIKNMEIIHGKIASDFVGQTPDLNSSLGVNAADGEPIGPTEAPVADSQSKLSTFWEKNSTWLTGLGEAVLTPKTTTTTSPFPPAQEEKKGISAIVWILIVIVVIVIGVVIYKQVKK